MKQSKKDKQSAEEAKKMLQALEEQKLSARSFLEWYLKQPAKTKAGFVIKSGERQLNNMEAVLCKLLAKDDPYSITTALSIGGALSSETAVSQEEQQKKQQAFTQRKEEVKKAATLIRRQLQKDGLYYPALNEMVKHCASLEVSIAEMEQSLIGQPTVIETVSREGATRVIAHPGFKSLERLQRDHAQAVRELLSMARKFKADSEVKEGGETMLTQYLQAMSNIK